MGGGSSAVAAGGRGGTSTQLVYDRGRDGTLCGRACTLHSHLSHRVVFFDSCACSECPFCLTSYQLIDSAMDLQLKDRY